jgi:hypothetical protein
VNIRAGRPLPPSVLIEPAGPGGWSLGAPPGDLESWRLQILDAFGTRSKDAARTFLDQLAALCIGDPHAGQLGWPPDQGQLDAAVSMVDSVRPRNEIEASRP